MSSVDFSQIVNFKASIQLKLEGTFFSINTLKSAEYG